MGYRLIGIPSTVPLGDPPPRLATSRHVEGRITEEHAGRAARVGAGDDLRHVVDEQLAVAVDLQVEHPDRVGDQGHGAEDGRHAQRLVGLSDGPRLREAVEGGDLLLPAREVRTGLHVGLGNVADQHSAQLGQETHSTLGVIFGADANHTARMAASAAVLVVSGDALMAR